eukprot:Hpha_TRINITY_DN12186_c0_g1::TRINITY_DN12186_c0_g1_i3::g.81911::m.81911
MSGDPEEDVAVSVSDATEEETASYTADLACKGDTVVHEPESLLQRHAAPEHRPSDHPRAQPRRSPSPEGGVDGVGVGPPVLAPQSGKKGNRRVDPIDVAALRRELRVANLRAAELERRIQHMHTERSPSGHIADFDLGPARRVVPRSASRSPHRAAINIECSPVRRVSRSPHRAPEPIPAGFAQQSFTPTSAHSPASSTLRRSPVFTDPEPAPGVSTNGARLNAKGERRHRARVPGMPQHLRPGEMGVVVQSAKGADGSALVWVRSPRGLVHLYYREELSIMPLPAAPSAHSGEESAADLVRRRIRELNTQLDGKEGGWIPRPPATTGALRCSSASHGPASVYSPAPSPSRGRATHRSSSAHSRMSSPLRRASPSPCRSDSRSRQGPLSNEAVRCRMLSGIVLGSGTTASSPTPLARGGGIVGTGMARGTKPQSFSSKPQSSKAQRRLQ